MELRHLRYVLAVADEGSFTRAAASLHVAQQALSQQIADLERELGVRVFDRLARGVRPTHAGAVFVQQARAIVAESERAVTQARRVAKGDDQQIRVGFVLGAVPDAEALVARFHRTYPAADIELDPMLSRDHPGALQHGRIDVALGLAPAGGEPGIADEVVGTAPLTCAFLPADHPLAGRERVWLRELQATPVLLPERDVSPYVVDQVTGELAARGLSFTRSELRVRGIPSISLVAFTYAWVPWFHAADPAPGTVCCRIEDPFAVRIWLLSRRDDESPIVAQFVSSCRESRALVPAHA